MSISSISVQNYRAFKEPAVLTLAPLAMIFGPNNTGKSSLARLLPSIAKSCTSLKHFSFVPVSASDWETNGKDFLYGKGTSPKLQFKISFLDATDKPHEADFEITLLADRGISLVSKLSIKTEEREPLVLEWTAEEVDESAPHSNLYRIGSTDRATSLRLNFEGLVPRFTHNGELNAAEVESLEALASELDALPNKVHWLGPVRHTPDRIERRIHGGAQLSANGREATQILAASFKEKTALFDSASSWFERTVGQKLVCIEGAFDGDELFSIALSPLVDSAVRVPIADTGAGIAQVLPIIVLGTLAAQGALGPSPILVLENPELHLHDSLHDDVGRFLVEIASAECHPLILVETHSENLLLAVEIEIAEGRINHSQVAINWVRVFEGGSAVENITLDALGTPSSQWPRGAFETAPSQAKKLFLLRQGTVAEGGDGPHSR